MSGQRSSIHLGSSSANLDFGRSSTEASARNNLKLTMLFVLANLWMVR